MTKRSLAEFLKTEIFDPLQMLDTFLPNVRSSSAKEHEGKGEDQRATGYIFAPNGEGYLRRHQESPLNGDSGIISSIDDLLKWYTNRFSIIGSCCNFHFLCPGTPR